MTAVAGGARHDPRILTAGMQGRRGCLQAFRGPRRPPGVLTTTAHPATTTTTSATLASTSSGERYGNSLIQFPPPSPDLAPLPLPPSTDRYHHNKCTNAFLSRAPSGFFFFFFFFIHARWRCFVCSQQIRRREERGEGGRVRGFEQVRC